MATITKFRLPVKEGNVITYKDYDLPAPTPTNLGFGYGICETAYSTPKKDVTIQGFNLFPGSIVSVKFVNDVCEDASLDINNENDHYITHRGYAIHEDIILAGDTATFMYDGAHYVLLATDRIPTVTDKTITL